jgi:hypothetical protein
MSVLLIQRASQAEGRFSQSSRDLDNLCARVMITDKVECSSCLARGFVVEVFLLGEVTSSRERTWGP